MNPAYLVRLQHQPQSLTYLLNGLSEEQLRQRPQADKWSIFENLAHLGRYQEVFSGRIQQMQKEDSPVFGRYVAEEDSSFPEWTTHSLEELTTRLHGERALLNAFMSILKQEQLERTARHPLYGLMNIEGWTEFFLLHEAHHLFTIFKLSAQLRRDNTHFTQ